MKQSSAAPVAGARRRRFFAGDAGPAEAAIAEGIATVAGCESIAVDICFYKIIQKLELRFFGGGERVDSRKLSASLFPEEGEPLYEE